MTKIGTTQRRKTCSTTLEFAYSQLKTEINIKSFLRNEKGKVRFFMQYPLEENSIEALPSNLIIQHLNHFIVKYSQALISFSDKCENKLLNLEIKVSKIQAGLVLLEKKLEPIQIEKPQIETVRKKTF